MLSSVFGLDRRTRISQMPESTEQPQGDVIRQVRSALMHLYDTAYLQTHPLSAIFDAQQTLDVITRAQRLRRTLLDCIEMLRPQPGRPTPAEATRAYAILTYRYVDGFSMDEIIAKLALSRRQIYREHEKGIMAVANLLAEQRPPQASTDIDIAQREVSRLRQSGRTENLNISDILDGVVHLLTPVAQQTATQFHIKGMPNLPLIQGDRVQLRQAFIALLTYVIDCEPRIIEIELAVQTQPHSNQVVFQLHMPTASATNPADTPSIHSQHSHDKLDLSIAKALFEAQGAEVCFLAAADAWDACIRFGIQKRSTILVVDDNADLVELFRRYLGGHQVSVIGVNESAHALQTAIEQRPALIMLDVMMPSLDGWEVLQQLQSTKETNQIPIVVCSVLKEHKLALSMGASGTLTKPVSQTDFLDMVRRWLGVIAPAS